MKNRLKFAVIGHPISHSLSPIMHMAAYKALGLPHLYTAVDVTPKQLPSMISSFRQSGYRGLNVTIPHKRTIIQYLDELSEEAKLIGAVNTVHFREDGIAKGYNTDGVGCVRALKEAGVEVKGKHVLILGAGGAARAIAFQLLLKKAKITISNRESGKERAVKLVEELKRKIGGEVEILSQSVESLAKALPNFDLVINATPVGMHPNEDQTLIPAEIIPPNIVVMDIVYNPIETRLLKDARARGCKTIDGVGMLVHQGAESFRIWLGIEPPVQVMRSVVEERLRAF